MINRQEERERERERERKLSSEEERDKKGREREGEDEADDAGAVVCPGGYEYRNIPGKPSTRLRLRIPVGSPQHPLSTSAERVPCLEGNNRRIL